MIINDLNVFSWIFKEFYLKITRSRRSKMAPKKPDMVIIVSVVISRLCTGHLVSRSTIYSFPQISGKATTKKKKSERFTILEPTSLSLLVEK